MVCCEISLEAIITFNLYTTFWAIHGNVTIPLHKILVNEMVEDLETLHDVIDLHKIGKWVVVTWVKYFVPNKKKIGGYPMSD